MPHRVLNFGAGPAMLPHPVLEQVAGELTDLDGSGMSVLEISHRGAAFERIAERTEADLRDLLAIPHNYRVIFGQGGATLQFAAVPLNLCSSNATADHLVTGEWSRRAAHEGERFSRVNVAIDGASSGYRTIPPQTEWTLTQGAAFVAYAVNETIHGVEFPYVPETGDVPLVADMSSTILSRPIDVSRFGVIYFGAQKNLGPAGLTVVIVRDDLIGKARAGTPSVLDYEMAATSGSMLNTPPTFAWYVSGLVLQWIRSEGGLAEMAARNQRKQQLLYDAIDRSSLFDNEVDPAYRSWTNVPFQIREPHLEPVFLTEAATAGLTNLKGHRTLGGFRASIYNAMPESGVRTLVQFIEDFDQRWAGMA